MPMLTKISLFTRAGEFVSDAFIMPLNPLPEVVWWGNRVFVRSDARTVYNECLLVPAWSSPDGPARRPLNNDSTNPV